MPMRLHGKARTLADSGWLSGDSRAIYLVDDEIRERFEALLGPRPMFLEADDQTQRSERREFHTLEEIETSAAAVEMIQVTGEVLWRFLPLEHALTSGNELHRLSTFLLTMMAWHQRGDGLQPDSSKCPCDGGLSALGRLAEDGLTRRSGPSAGAVAGRTGDNRRGARPTTGCTWCLRAFRPAKIERPVRRPRSRHSTRRPLRHLPVAGSQFGWSRGSVMSDEKLKSGLRTRDGTSRSDRPGVRG